MGGADPERVAREVLRLRKHLAEVDHELDELSCDFHESELQAHIHSLHVYNEIKDVGQLLFGKLAETQGTTTAQVYERFGLKWDD